MKTMFKYALKSLMFALMISTVAPVFGQTKTTTKSAAKATSTVKGKRQTFAGYSFILPEGMVYHSTQNNMDSYMDPSGKLIFTFQALPAGDLSLEEFKKGDEVARQAEAEGKCSAEQFISQVLTSRGLTVSKPTKSLRVAMEEALFIKMSGLLSQMGLTYQRKLLPAKAIRKDDYTLIYSSTQPHSTTVGIIFDYKEKKIIIVLMLEANVDNRARMATILRSGAEESVEKVVDQATAKQLEEKFVESIKKEEDNLIAQLDPKGENIKVSVEHQQYNGNICGMNVNYSFDIANATSLPLVGTTAFRIVVMQQKDANNLNILYDDARYDKSMPDENGVSHYSGTFFVPYGKVRYTTGLNTFKIHFAIVNDNDTKEYGSKDITTSQTLNSAYYYY